MPNTTPTKAEIAAAAKAAAKKPAPKARGKQAAKPVATEATAESVTQSARAKRAETVATLLKAGAHKPNVRATTSVNIPHKLAKYDFSHLAALEAPKRLAKLPAGTVSFYTTNLKAFAGKTVSAEQFDNAKLARCITAGLIKATGGNDSGTHLSGDVQITFPKA